MSTVYRGFPSVFGCPYFLAEFIIFLSKFRSALDNKKERRVQVISGFEYGVNVRVWFLLVSLLFKEQKIRIGNHAWFRF